MPEIMEGWHIDKRISITHLITTFMIAVGALTAYMDLKQRVDVNTMHIEDNALEISKVEARQLEQNSEIIRRLERISDRLDAFMK